MLNGRDAANELRVMPAVDLIEFSYIHVLKGLERSASLVDVASSIGRRIRQKLKPRDDPDSVADVQFGWFILKSYLELNILGYRKKHQYKNGKKDKHRSYFLFAKNWEAVKEMMLLVDTEKCDMFPTRQPVSNWDGNAYHPETGISIIKKGHKDALKQVQETDFSYITDTLNKLNNTGWRINKNVFNAYKATLNKDKNPFKFSKEIDPIKRASLIIEVEAIQRLAEAHLENTFYHIYNLDFRGRIYPNTAFLHEQGSDNAKGLLLMEQSVPLGDEGLYWLCVHTSNTWGNDKVTLDERAQFTIDNWAEYLGYANDPIANSGWMDADKPFCFLACCYELQMIDTWVNSGEAVEDFPSNLPIYIDGSNNGVQHLVAMSKDEEVAPLVNLVPQDLPGDVYMFIAESVWRNLEKKKELLTEEQISQFDRLYSEAKSLQRKYENAPERSEKKAQAYKAVAEWRNHNRNLREKLMCVYWLNITDKKIQRKTLKRNVMTLGYGGTPYGMGNQIIEDTRDINEYLRDKEHLWGKMLGNLVYDTCYEELKGPASMLRLFQRLAERANEQKKFLQYSTPITNFPVVQAYRKAAVKRTELKYGSDILKVQLQVWEEATINTGKAVQGAAPNIVHSLDAVHLTTIVHDADYPVSVVHDSFGSHAGNMQHMFMHTREKFVELYEADPLTSILTQLDCLDLNPKKGTLDVSEILRSDYAFA